MTHGLVEDKLQGLVVQFLCLLRDFSDYLPDVWLGLVCLRDGELVTGALSDL